MENGSIGVMEKQKKALELRTDQVAFDLPTFAQFNLYVKKQPIRFSQPTGNQGIKNLFPALQYSM